MEVLPIIYLSYMFIAIYLLLFTFLLFLNNRKKLFDVPIATSMPTVSVVVPAYNESRTIKDTIDHIFAIDYPNIIEVIIVNHASTDNTKEIVLGLRKKYPKLILLDNPSTLRRAAVSKNLGLKYAKGELIAMVDADSYPAVDSLKKMVGYFDNERVGGVTCSVLLRNPTTLLERIQDIEYRMIALVRKTLEFIDSIYVTPGPLALYRKRAIDEINGFDDKNMTEDIEIAWHLLKEGWQIKMSMLTSVTTTAPTKLKVWYKQRLRWAIGGLECISKYKNDTFKKGTFGSFIIPFFIFQFFLGLVGLGVVIYVLIRNLLVNFFFVKYSAGTGVPLLTMNDLYITPNFLNYLGIVLFIASFIFTLTILSIMKRVSFKKQKIFDLLFYSIFYLMVYPIIAIHAIYKYFKGGYTWR